MKEIKIVVSLMIAGATPFSMMLIGLQIVGQPATHPNVECSDILSCVFITTLAAVLGYIAGGLFKKDL